MAVVADGTTDSIYWGQSWTGNPTVFIGSITFAPGAGSSGVIFGDQWSDGSYLCARDGDNIVFAVRGTGGAAGWRTTSDFLAGAGPFVIDINWNGAGNACTIEVDSVAETLE